jgi:pimeloyl-ACP methyl ester carboxylesterase
MSEIKKQSLSNTQILNRQGLEPIAYNYVEGSSPTIIFLGGLMSDMTGTKAQTLEDHCKTIRKSFIRYDYTGHGLSGGSFIDCNITDWHIDTLSIIDQVVSGPVILVGSSMGGWQMLLAAKKRPGRIAGLVGIAAAPDFTEDLMWNTFPEALREQLMESGCIELPSKYDHGVYPISRDLIEDGRKNLILRNSIDFKGPVRLIHGMCDNDVPWQTSLQINACLRSTDVITTLVKNGDHRLSEPEDLKRMCQIVTEVCEITQSNS